MNDNQLQEFKHEFNQKYGYVSHELSDTEIQEYLNQDHVKNELSPKQLDLFYDYLLSQGLCEVQE